MVGMSKRRLSCWSIMLAILVAFVVWLEPTRVGWGWLRGEAFYEGRPTCWWRTELERWDGPYYWSYPTYRRRDSSFEVYLKKVLPTKESELDLEARDEERSIGPRILRGDVAALPVLKQLHDAPSPRVQALVEIGLVAQRNGL
jgi:hypothetical protein